MKYILIPVKELAFAKQRLKGLMSQEERTALARLMLERLLHEVARARGYDGVSVVTLEEQAALLTQQFGFELIEELQQKSQSLSVDYGSRLLAARGARSVLCLPTDLPLIEAKDIENILARVTDQPATVMVPSRDERGTNALARTPPQLFASHFGLDSFVKHLAEARRCGATCELLSLPRIALDLDSPDDVEYFLENSHDSRIQEFLYTLRIRERLERVASTAPG